jgi:hypothetical protein
MNNPASITMNSPITETASWTHQYELTVNSDHDTPGGSDWYTAGTTAYATLGSGTVSGDTGVQYVFTGWSGDATGTGLTSDPITMDGPKVATAVWKTQYYLTMSTNYGTVSPGDGWHDAGLPVGIGAAPPALVYPDDQERYVFGGWSGFGDGCYVGNDNPAANKVVMYGPITESASWIHQFKLTMSTNFGGVSYSVMYTDPYAGSGWITEGALVGLLATAPVAGSGEQFVWNGWTGSGTGSYTGDDTHAAIQMMQGPISEAASWIHQYELTVSSDHDTPGGSGWYAADAQVSATLVSGTVSGDTGVQYVFTGWSGDATGTDLTSDPIVMNGPKTATADWKTQYSLTMSTNFGTVSPGDGWHDAGSTVDIEATPPPLVYPTGERYSFLGWTGSGTISYTGTNNPAGITMNSPISEAASWTHDFLLEYSANFGQIQIVLVDPAKGIPGQIWCHAGDSATLTAIPPTPGAGERYVWNGWTGFGTISYTGTNNPAGITMNGPVTETASWTHQYLVTFDQSGIGVDTTGTVVTVNGVTRTCSQLPYSMWVDSGGSVTYGYTSPVPAGTGKQYVLTTPVPSPASPMTVTGSISVTGTYNTQYYLTVSSAHDTPGGEGWYSAGADAFATLVSDTVSGDPGVRYVFTGWSGAATGTDLTSDPIVMNGPKTATADWKTQYYLTMIVFGGTVSPGDGWYDAGSTVDIEATPPALVYPADKEMYVFYGWGGSGMGSYSGNDNSAEITMNGPILESASWLHNYRLTMSTNFGEVTYFVMYTDPYAGSGWIKEGALVGILATAPVAGSGEQYVWNGWTGSGTGSYSGVDSHAAISMMQVPISEAASWTHQYELTLSTDFGTVSPAAGSHWYDAGSKITISATYPDTITGEQYVWNGWTGSGSGTYYTGTTASPEITMDGPITEAASWTHQYELTVSSDHDTPGGSGWYPADAHVSATLASGTVSGGSGVQYVFTGWSVDATGTGLTSDLITMDGPKTTVATWGTQYELTMSTNYGTVSPAVGSHWYDAGSIVNIEATPPPLVYPADKERYVWNGWTGTGTGSYSGSDNPATDAVTMNGPITEAASWTHQYCLIMRTNFGSVSPIAGTYWCDAGSIVAMSATSPTPGAGEQYVWNGWTGTGTGGYTGMNKLPTFAISGPVIESASWTHQYYLTTTSGYGTISPPSRWCDADATVGVTVTSSTTIPVSEGSRVVFTEWRCDGTFYSANPSCSIVIDGPKTMSAEWKTQYYLEVSDEIFWQTAQETSGSGNVNPQNPSVAMDSNGNLVAVWQDTDGLWSNCYLNGLGWQTPQLLWPGSVLQPSIALDSSGEGFIVWVSAGKVYACSYSLTSGFGTAPAVLSNGSPYYAPATSCSPRIVLWGDGNAMVVWAAGNRYVSPGIEVSHYIYGNRYSPGSGWRIYSEYGWHDHELFSESLRIVVDPNGKAIVTFDCYTNDFVHAIPYSAVNGWTAINGDVHLGSESRAIIDASGHILIAFRSGSDYVGHIYVYVSSNGGLEGSFVPFPGSPFTGLVDASTASLNFIDSHDPYLTIGSDGKPVVVWRARVIAGGQNYYSICAAHYVSGSSWGPGTIVRCPYAPTSLDVAWYENNYLCVVWTDAGGRIWSYIPSGGPDLPAMLLHSSGVRCVQSQFSASSEGYVAVAWSQSVSGTTPFDIYVNFLARGPPGVTRLGEGWYDSSDTATFSIGPTVYHPNTDTYCSFGGWTGDVVSSDPIETILMDGPKKVSAHWITSCYLTLCTDPPGIATPTGGGWYAPGSTVTVTTPQYIDLVAGSSRYRFDHWDGATGTFDAGSVTMSGPMTVTAVYVLQYHLSVVTNAGVASGEGWYDAGSVVTLTATPPALVYPTDQERYVWNGWTGTGTGSYSGTDNPASNAVTMNAPITETASWTHEYYLTVVSGHDTPGGEEWYSAGADAFATLTSDTVSGSSGVQYVFTGWSGDASGISLTSDPITMNGPSTATADWKTQYYLTMSTNYGTVSPGDGWHDAGSTVNIEATPPPLVYPADKERYVWNGWTGSGTISYTGTNNPAGITMNGPITEAASWTHQYYLTMSADYGSVSPGNGWHDAASKFTISATAPTPGAGERYVWNGWTGFGTTSYTGGNNPASVTMNSPISESASWTHQFYLQVNTNPPNVDTPTGTSWYVAGTTASFSVTSPWNNAGIHYVFTAWSGDSSSSTPTSSVTMDRTKTVTANWALSYFTTLVYEGDVACQYSDYATLKATLTKDAGGTPLAGMTVKFTVGMQSTTATTDEFGIAMTSLQIMQPKGAYTILVEFTGSEPYLSSSTTAGFSINPEDVTVEYTGDTVVPTTTKQIDLRATVYEAQDGNLGNLANMKVTFTVYNPAAGGLGSPLGGTPKTVTVVPVPGSPGIGVATWTVTIIPGEGTYYIDVSVDPLVNLYYIAPTPEPSTLTVYLPTGTFVTGGGWIDDSSGGKGHFAFVVRYNAKGQVQGQSLYIYREGGFQFIVKSTAWNGLAIDGAHAWFEGKCVVQKYDLAMDTMVSSEGNYKFRVDVWDNTATGGKDVYQIQTWNKVGMGYHKAGITPYGELRGGSIVIHMKGQTASVVSEPMSPTMIAAFAVMMYGGLFLTKVLVAKARRPGRVRRALPYLHAEPEQDS